MKMSVFKKTLIILIVLALIGLSVTTIYILNERSIDTFEAIQYTPSVSQSTSLTIGLIGDSWVTGNKLDNFITAQLESKGITANIESIGHSGAKSRQLYRDLLSDESEPHSCKKLLLDDNIQYIVVIAGVNDSACHIGSDFYSEYMTNIVKTINAYSKHAIIIDVPEFGIEEQSKKALSRIKHTIFRILYDHNKTDVIASYRTALKSKLALSGLDYTILPFDAVITDYASNKELYANSSHLNKDGNKILGSYIANGIVEIIQQKSE